MAVFLVVSLLPAFFKFGLGFAQIVLVFGCSNCSGALDQFMQYFPVLNGSINNPDREVLVKEE